MRWERRVLFYFQYVIHVREADVGRVELAQEDPLHGPQGVGRGDDDGGGRDDRDGQVDREAARQHHELGDEPGQAGETQRGEEGQAAGRAFKRDKEYRREEFVQKEYLAASSHKPYSRDKEGVAVERDPARGF